MFVVDSTFVAYFLKVATLLTDHDMSYITDALDFCRSGKIEESENTDKI